MTERDYANALGRRYEAWLDRTGLKHSAETARRFVIACGAAGVISELPYSDAISFLLSLA